MTTKKFNIRRMEIEDVPGLLALGEVMFKESKMDHFGPFHHERCMALFYQTLNRDGGIAFLAEDHLFVENDDGEMVGMDATMAMFLGQVQPGPFGDYMEAIEWFFYVDPTARRTGVGRAMMERYIEEAKELGVGDGPIYIQSTAYRDPKEIGDFYESMGFHYCGGYYCLTDRFGGQLERLRDEDFRDEES